MSNVLRLAIVDPSDNSRTQLKNMLLGMDIVWLEAECSRYEFFADVISQTKPDIGVIAIDSSPEKGLKLLEEVRDIAPECALLVVSTSTDGQTILRAMRSGAKEFLTQPIKDEDMIGALDRRRWLHELGGEPGLHPRSRRAQQRGPRRSRHGPGRCRRLPR
jgi:pilus assembly protein CpaE